MAVLACVMIVSLIVWGTAYKISVFHPEAFQVVHTKISMGDGPLKRGLTNIALLTAVLVPWLVALTQRQATQGRLKVDLENRRPIRIVASPAYYFRPPPARYR